jgi:hypothetical protein
MIPTYLEKYFLKLTLMIQFQIPSAIDEVIKETVRKDINAFWSLDNMCRFVCACCDEPCRKGDVTFAIINEAVMVKLEDRLPWLSSVPMQLREDYILHRAISSPFFNRLKKVALSGRGVTVEVKEDTTGYKPLEARSTLEKFIKKCLGYQPMRYVHFIGNGVLLILNDSTLNNDEKQGKVEKLVGELSSKTFIDFITDMSAKVDDAEMTELNFDVPMDDAELSDMDTTSVTAAVVSGFDDAELSDKPSDDAELSEMDIMDITIRKPPPVNKGTTLTLQLCKNCSCVVEIERKSARRWPPPLALANNWASGSLPVHLRDCTALEIKMVTLAPIYAGVKVIGRNRFSLTTHSMALLATPGPAATQVKNIYIFF